MLRKRLLSNFTHLDTCTIFGQDNLSFVYKKVTKVDDVGVLQPNLGKDIFTKTYDACMFT